VAISDTFSFDLPEDDCMSDEVLSAGTSGCRYRAQNLLLDTVSWNIPKEFDETGASKGADVHQPIIIEALQGKGNVTCIQSGAHHTVACTDKGELLVWGRLDGYQLGLKVSDLPQDEVVRDSAGNPRILTVPTQIPNINATQVAADSDHCVAIDKKGKA
jgi:regulator of chromosome condensation